MGRTPCCDSDANVKKGPWTTEEDDKLREYIEENGAGNWRNLPKLAGLNRCGKSCRLRWANYLRPDIKRGRFSDEEEQLIIHHHSVLGNKWSAIAARLPGRTDNEIKNYWNTHLRKKLLKMGIDPITHRPRTDLNLFADIPNLIAASNLSNALQFPNLQLLQTMLQLMANNSSPPPNIDTMSLLGLQNIPNLMAMHNLQQNNLLGITSMMPNFSTFDGTQEVVAPMNYGLCSSTETPTPSLVSAATPEPVKSSVSSPATSKPLESWDGLNLDELGGDFGWKDILDQISWYDEL